MIVTPNLPPEAKTAIRLNFEKPKPLPSFIKAVDLPETFGPGYCKNCAGLGAILIQFARSGPYKEVPRTTDPITYYDGGEQFGKGWYIVGHTEGFACPNCKGQGHIEITPEMVAAEKSRADYPERKFHRPQALEHLFEKVQA